MQEIEKVTYKGYTITMGADEDGPDPREWDNFGRMLCLHPRYNLGDKHKMSAEEIIAEAKAPGALALPLFLLDHSGLAMRTVTFWEDSGGWDTSRVGYIIASAEEIKKEFGDGPDARDKARALLQAEVSTYDDYLRGECYYYMALDPEGVMVGSCGGYLGSDGYAEAMAEAKREIDADAEVRERDIEATHAAELV